ncbi:acetoacetate--CoA ligase [Candidatus Foliamicus sp.]
MWRFMREAGFSDYPALHRWSIQEPEDFWGRLWHFCEIRASAPPTATFAEGERLQDAVWFAGARLNFAENLLWQSDSHVAIIYRGERGERKELRYGQLREEVARIARGLSELGVQKGDSVVAWMPNMPETVVLMLAAASIGAVFASCSQDFGVEAVLERFGALRPKVLLAADGYYFRGRPQDRRRELEEIRNGLPELLATVLVPTLGTGRSTTSDANIAPFHEFGTPGPLHFEPLSFDHPLYAVFSSGTTGAPKCIMHRAGGVLLQHAKEHRLHIGLTAEDTIYYLTTCGWMMWNWLVSGLAAGATLVLYEGSPLSPSPSALWKMAEEERITIFGTSAAYLKALEIAGQRPGAECDLSALHTVLSTGSPLAPQSYDYAYREIAQDIMLASIAGGTDLLGCFATGNPMLGVYRGEMQCRALGMAVEVFDSDGRPLRERAGELVCTRPFPSMPLGFLNDPRGEKYHDAYFAHFPDVWTHGDLAEITSRGGLIIHGRSDTVLNPRGIRIGTAEIYRVVEALEEVEEALAVAQQHQGDTRVILFLRLKNDAESIDTLKDKVRSALRRQASPRHVPAKIIVAPDLPRTLSGKISELAVRELIHGRSAANRDALANPESLDFFAHLEEELA